MVVSVTVTERTSAMKDWFDPALFTGCRDALYAAAQLDSGPQAMIFAYIGPCGT